MITRHGRPAGVLIGFESEDDWFEYRLENDPRFQKRIKQARASLRAGRDVALEDVELDYQRCRKVGSGSRVPPRGLTLAPPPPDSSVMGGRMAFVRTLLAAWMAVAVALLPAAGGAAVAANAAMTMVSGHAAMPCCDHMDQCDDAAACALKCFNFVASVPAVHTVPAVHGRARPWTAAPALHPHVRPPPTHPPPE